MHGRFPCALGDGGDGEVRPKLLDLFCGAGGAGVGYRRAGFKVTGVDIAPHDDYPFGLFVTDAIDFLDNWSNVGEWDAVHASPPCPRYSVATPAANRDSHPDLIEPVRARLIALGIPYVIENVPGSPLVDPVTLCGSMFGLQVRRHRLFESNIPIGQPTCQHRGQQVYGVYGQHGDKQGAVARPNGTSRGTKARDAEHAREVMGIDWMSEWSDLADAIPPAYTEHIGRELITSIEARSAA